MTIRSLTLIGLVAAAGWQRPHDDVRPALAVRSLGTGPWLDPIVTAYGAPAGYSVSRVP